MSLMWCDLGAFALPVFLPCGDARLGRAYIAVAAVAGASDCANDNVINDERQPAGYQNDLPFHQAERAVESLRVSLQLICRFGSALLQCDCADSFADGEFDPKSRSAVHRIQ